MLQHAKPFSNLSTFHLAAQTNVAWVVSPFLVDEQNEPHLDILETLYLAWSEESSQLE